MPPDAPTNGAESKNPKKSKGSFLTSPKVKAITARLRYVGEHVFGGDLAAYGQAVGFSEFWVKRILNDSTRLRLSTFAQFVESGVVSAEWLFCGSGPMLANDSRKDELAAYAPPRAIRSQLPTLDPTLLAQPVIPEAQPFITPEEYVINKDAMAFLPLARAAFHSRKQNKPVMLFLNADVVQAGITPIVIALLKNKVVTHVAMTSEAAACDLQTAKKNKADMSVFGSTLKLAANAGVGIAEGIGRWGLAPEDNRSASILAAAYDNNAAATVHVTIGETPLHIMPSTAGAEFGAVLGATASVDYLVFAEQVFGMAGDPAGTFIVAGSAQPALPLLSVAIDAGQRLPEPLDFSAVKIARISNVPANKNLDFFLSGDYRVLFPQFLDICQAVYKGKFERFLYERYGYKVLEHPQRAAPADRSD